MRPMQITRIEAIPIRIPLKPERRMISALGKHECRTSSLVVVHTDDGESSASAKRPSRRAGAAKRPGARKR